MKTTKVLIFKSADLLLEDNPDHFNLPHEDILELIDTDKHSVFTLEDTDAIKTLLLDVDESFLPPSGYRFTNFASCRDFHEHTDYPHAVIAYQLLNWSHSNRYCGVCGTPYEAMNPDRSKTCPHCHNIAFPQMSLAVITAIIKDGQILLAHNNNFAKNFYGLIAGFVEMGEPIEDAVHREIQEEVGIKVKNVRYFSSQPWPFPNSLMIGFVADYDSGEICVDGEEIGEAGWFTPETFPNIPHPYSIARKLIDAYKEGLLTPLSSTRK